MDNIKRIKVLPEFVVNQIAAGEVVERPASILKELLENSIDANSTIIRVYLENGGTTNIKVVDNGNGIHPEDIPLVFKQHATSKITSAKDLANINSLGFRGEALASIASVAKVTIVSKQDEPHGTTLEAREIFYNIPARRKFLRSGKTEFNYSQEILKRIALSNFSVGFIFYHNNKLIKNLPICINDTSQKEKRLIKLLGKKFVDHATFFSISQNGLDLSGWISGSESVAGSSIQYFYLNNRIVKDKLLSGAIRQAAQKLFLPISYCLYLNLDPNLVDVNVHPTKQEVRFRDPKIIYAFVYENILEVLTSSNCSSATIDNPYLSLGLNSLDNGNLNIPVSNGFNEPINLNVQKDLNFEEEFVEETVINEGRENLKANVNNEHANYQHNNILNKVNDADNIKLFSIFYNKYVFFELKQKFNTELNFVYMPSALKWLIEKKLQMIEPLIGNQLIIPERVKLDIVSGYNLDAHFKFLDKFKFTVNQIHEDVFIITSIPNCLKLLRIEVNYTNFLLDFLRIKPDLLDNLSNIEFINLLILHINTNKCESYSKVDLTILIEALIKENYSFIRWNEKQFASLVK